MRVLLTGHNGYIGSIMAPAFQAAGHEVTGLDTFFFRECTFEKIESQLPVLQKDVRDITLIDLQGFDAIVHLAALCNDPLGDLNTEWTYDINHTAAVYLAQLGREAGVQRFLYASSCSMYGASGDTVLTEDAPLRPLTAYAISKVRAEEDISRLADAHFSPVFMRNATAYGISPRLRTDIVLNNLVGWAYITGKVRIMSDGLSWRPIVHVEDIASAFVSALVAPRDAIHNQAFNVGVNGENYQIRDLAEIVQEVVPGCVVEYAGSAGHDPRSYQVNFGKLARTLTSFRPIWNARLGAQQLYQAFQETKLRLADFQGRRYVRLAQLRHLLDTQRLDDTLRWHYRGVA